MAKPTGALQYGELRLELHESATGGYTSSDICHMYFIYRLPIMPKWWQDDTNASTTDLGFEPNDPGIPLRVAYTQSMYHDESGADDGTIYTKFFTSQETQSSFTRNVSTTLASPTWQAQDEDTDYPIGVQRFFMPPGEQPPYFMVAEGQFYYDGHNNNQAEINSIDIEQIIDDPGTEKLPYFSHATNKLYEPDMPASAWHIAHCLCRGYYSLLRENKSIFSTALSGNGDNV